MKWSSFWTIWEWSIASSATKRRILKVHSCAVHRSVVLKLWTLRMEIQCLTCVRYVCSVFCPCDVIFLGCQRLADYLEGVKKHYESTAQVLKHNCETNGHGESCYKLGAYHVTGKGNTCGFIALLLYSLWCLWWSCLSLCHTNLYKIQTIEKFEG